MVAIDEQYISTARVELYNALRERLLIEYRTKVVFDSLRFEDAISWLHADMYNRTNYTFFWRKGGKRDD
ncbi:hypothetical protein ATZ36_16905 [Candidatus Endomicrobiellum trichonymphae]|jgi:hypothetical protein|uniref:Uncharacterized protein n=1 Tax=Endomicrobium trichonymphae TaxID=1408204 RepID=A0A1E5IJH7_ENDTX|nr:hypothetical protein ATZ36_16905 [Candidatus Endomicrobium trichonymphae]